MRQKILIIGNSRVMVNDIFDNMPLKFEMKKCEFNNVQFDKTCTQFEPDMVIVCLDQDKNDDYDMFNRYFKSREKYRFTPIISVGTQEDCIRFDSFVDSMMTTHVLRPFTFDKVYSALFERLSKRNRTIEEASLERKKTNPLGIKSLQESMKKRVLVIDDDIRMLKTIKNQLAGIYNVALAVSGEIGLKYLREHICDVVLLDYIMPEKDGPAVLEEIRQISGCEDLPVIFLTGVKDSSMVKKCLALRPQGYLLKPVNHDKLIIQLEEALRE